ncbi:Hpt domain-containing protein [bacterium SCSIO 12741]|nr:Hpt domain-containing protein [bacterium SCSIO 12741]
MDKLYNLDELREMTGNDESFMKEMIQLFVTNNKDYLEQLNQGLEEKDWKKVKFFAHKIKPSILMMKIGKLEDNIYRLNEFAGEEKNLSEIPALVEKLNDILPQVLVQLSEE